ncbi:Ankyrin repeat-containing domain protein [Metarhizium guizhouense ARSEF 977]|uniref:Ankyrin repeat-containing domain protein n=1 Tax=Metarhizium guizhouense (strain ARSEF 977) TaxID=1276136 RepID=A0A0B4H0T7_METGA|nr:Ankyrin repeat-containing domain protein [Metarhizium guizhouense ARSEF 977]
MAEVVGLVASVVTLGELTTKVVKLKSLWDKVRNVPEDIQSQLDELEALNILITEVEAEAAAEQDALRDTPAGALSLRYCKKAAKELEDQATLRWLSGSAFGGIAGAQCSQVVQEGRDDGEEVRTTQARVRFPSWVAQAAWDILTYRSSRGFTWKLTSWNVVPGDSPILEAVKRGPFTDVMALISSGDASLYDRDDNGKTLLHYAVYCRNFDTAIKPIKTGHSVMETDNLGLFPCTAPSASPQADTTKSLELLSMVISRGDFSNLLEGLIDESATITAFKPSQFDRLIWVIPGFLELIDNDLSWNFSQLPLSSKFRTFDWSVVRADTLDAILSRYSITLQDVRQMLDYSFGHSLHEFAAQYLVQPNFRKTLPGSWRYAGGYDGETNGDIAVKNAQLWKGYAFGLVSAMEFDYLVKEREFNLLGRMTPLLYATMKTMSRLALRPDAGPQPRWEEEVNDNVRSLLDDVSRGGIRLEEYGRVEFSLFTNNDFARTRRCRAVMGYNHEAVGGPYLVSLQYGSRPEDWRFVWDNLVEEFAGEFWEMLEIQPLNMPGAWVD